METTEKKITRATFKSFIKKNVGGLFVICNSSFDGRVDCVMPVESAPVKVETSVIDFDKNNTFGIQGLWLVGDSRDWYRPYEDQLFKGIQVSNCCGESIVAVLK